MSFGFSVGDFIAAGKLIHDVIESVQDVGGAKFEFQELTRELRGLETALQHLDKLQSDSSSQDRTIQSIKFAALSCRQPLEQFLAKIKKFDSTLDVWAKGQTSKTIVRKVQWGLGMRNEVTRLQGYLNLHIATINMLLAEHSLEKMSLGQQKAESDSFQVHERLGEARNIIESVGNTVAGQMALIQHTNSTMRSLMNLICGDFMTSWRSLGQKVAQLCVSMQQIYGIVIEIKASITPIDTRRTFFQTPLLCEDALGFKFPIPSEWDYGMVENHIRYRFREGIGSLEVQLGNWELFKTRNNEQVISPQTRLLPGLEITMAIIVPTPILSDGICPIFGCRSHDTTVACTGGRICCTCQTHFSRATKKHIGFETLVQAIDSESSDTTHAGMYPGSRHSEHVSKEHNFSVEDGLKNVRWSEEADSECVSVGNKEDEKPPSTTDSHLSFHPLDTYKNSPILDAALKYLDQVKIAFSDKADMYDRFLDAMKDFKSGAIDTRGVMARIVDLFPTQPALIIGFKQFLPPGYDIQIGSHLDSQNTLPNGWRSSPPTFKVITPYDSLIQPLAREKRKQGNEGEERISDARDDAESLVDQPGQRKPKRLKEGT